MPAPAVRRFYGLLTLFFGGVTLFLVALLPVQLTLGELPLVGGSEPAAYFGAEGGALSAALTWLCARVYAEPTRSTLTAGPMAVALFGMVAVRLVVYLFGASMAGVVGPFMIGEMIAFAVLGGLTLRFRTAGEPA